jgi:hypothetical protein
MQLESARALKQELLGTIVNPFAMQTSRIRVAGARAVARGGAGEVFGVQARSVHAVQAVQRSVAIGVAPKGRDFRVAVRVQRQGLRDSALVDRIRAEAHGEVDLRVVGRIDKRIVTRPLAAAPWYRKRQRPLQIGASIGHVDVTAGTIGAFVTARGVTYVLSNNHVLANEDLASRGDAIVQPGTFDGGQVPRDRVATLTRWVRFKPTGVNFVDAAIARVADGVEVDPTRLRDLVGGADRALAGLGAEFADPGTDVFKVGRTTGARKGRVTAFDLDNVVVGFDAGNIRFDGQVEIEGAGRRAFSDGGDSGSLIVDADMQAVALLFAGSESGGSNGLGLTYANPIHEVLAALKVAIRLQ